MKKITFLILLIVFSNFGFSQDFQLFDGKKNSPDKAFKKQLKNITRNSDKLLDSIFTDSTVIVKVEVKENKYKVFYAKAEGEKIEITEIPMIYGEKLSYNQFGIFSLSLFTVPIKIRPKQDELAQEFKSDVKSVGVYSSLLYFKRKNILNDGSIREHKLSVGFFASPASEEFNPDNTNGLIEKSNRLVISGGLAFSYTYKSIVLTFIPMGYDVGTTSDKKDWVYNERRWWGFGIGLDSKFFGL